MAGAVSPYLTVPGHPFNSTELQQQFFGMSARDVYALLCKRSGCDAISAVTAMLPDKSGVWDTTALDLSKTYVGHRGVVPLLELCKLLHHLRLLNLSNNYLTNKSVWHVCKLAAFHPSLTSIDISRNDVSWTAGMCVLELVSRNHSIAAVNLEHTLIKPAVTESITLQIRRNAFAGNRHHRRGPVPTNHPLTIRQRALKRFFREAVQRDGATDGRLPRAFLVDGYKELLRLSGREGLIDTKSPAFFSEFQRRCKSDTVDWETFMVLVMIEEASFDQALVDKLRACFADFDPDSSGYVEVADLRQILSHVLGHDVSVADAEGKMAFYAADASMTLTWDEFLLLMYDRGPVVGEANTVASATPLPRTRIPHH